MRVFWLHVAAPNMDLRKLLAELGDVICEYHNLVSLIPVASGRRKSIED